MDKIIFRKWPNGDIIALFPQISASIYGYSCNSYEHISQHGAANYSLVVSKTTLAMPAEYAELLAELEQIGYNPLSAKRSGSQDAKIRRAQYK